jgi:signal transduction histidine kinase
LHLFFLYFYRSIQVTLRELIVPTQQLIRQSPITAAVLITSGLLALLTITPEHTYAQSRAADSVQQILAAHPGRDTARVNLLNQVGRFFFNRIPTLTAAYGKEALHLSDSLFYMPGKIWAIRNIALGENASGNLEKQMDLTLKALQLAEQIRDNRAIGVLNADIGNILVEQQQPRQALPYQKRSLAIKQRLHDQNEIGRSLNGIGTIYIALNELDSALFYLNESEKVKLALNDHRGLAFAYENIGQVYFRKQQYPRALHYYTMAAQYYQESDNLQGLIKSHLNMGLVYIFLEDFSTAEDELKKAARLNKSINNPRHEMVYYKYMAQLDSARGNYTQALADYKQFQSRSEDLLSTEKARLIANSTEKYESAKKQHENQLLKKEQLLHLSTIRQQKIFVIFCIALFLVLGTITIVLFRLFKRLQDVYGQLNQRNRRVQQQNQIITDQNTALENANQVKDKIFSVISHDLRAPLGILEGMLFLLRDEKMDADQFRYFADELWRDMRNTSFMMDNLLQWASSQMKGLRVSPDDFNITQLLNSEFELLQSQARQKQIQLSHSLPATIQVFADQHMIRMVLRNLIGNAIKFTPANGHIVISYQLQPDKVEVIVKDSGIGIAPENQSKVFSTIYYSTTGTQNEKGCGLGLPLSKDFIERNHGSIWFHCHKDKGTSFHFTLPLSMSEEEETSAPGITMIVKDKMLDPTGYQH